MLKVQEIREIIKLIDESSIDEFVFEQEDVKVELRKSKRFAVQAPAGVMAEQSPSAQLPAQPAAVPITKEAVHMSPAADEDVAVSVPAGEEKLHTIVSPMVGTFYQSPSPDSDPYVQVGTEIKADTIVCIVEAMKLFNEIEAEVEGKIAEIIVKDGELVEYGQPLFLVEPK